MADVIANISATCERLGEVELSGVKLESADRDLLNVSWGDLDQHVAMQPAAMAFFGSLKKEAKRRLDNIKSGYDRWEKKKYAEAKVAVESGTTAKSAIKVEDVKARFIIDNEPEIEKWNGRVEKAQADYDTLDNWMEAWKQKGFSLHEYVSIESDERRGGSGSMVQKPQMGGGARRGKKVTGEVSQTKIKTVRDIMKRHREGKQGNSGT